MQKRMCYLYVLLLPVKLMAIQLNEKTKNQSLVRYLMSCCTRKTTVCICENKDADQRSYCEAVQRLCYCYTDSTIPLLSKSKISSI